MPSTLECGKQVLAVIVAEDAKGHNGRYNAACEGRAINEHSMLLRLRIKVLTGR